MGSRNTLREGYTLPDKVDLPELKALLEDTETLLGDFYSARESS